MATPLSGFIQGGDYSRGATIQGNTVPRFSITANSYINDSLFHIDNLAELYPTAPRTVS